MQLPMIAAAERHCKFIADSWGPDLAKVSESAWQRSRRIEQGHGVPRWDFARFLALRWLNPLGWYLYNVCRAMALRLPTILAQASVTIVLIWEAKPKSREKNIQ